MASCISCEGATAPPGESTRTTTALMSSLSRKCFRSLRKPSDFSMAPFTSSTPTLFWPLPSTSPPDVALTMAATPLQKTNIETIPARMT